MGEQPGDVDLPPSRIHELLDITVVEHGQIASS